MRKDQIDFGTDEKDIHTKVKPEHADGDGSQTAVGTGKVTHVVDVNRK